MVRFFKIGLIVTGKGEASFLPDLLRAVTASGTCHFHVIRRIGQRSALGTSRQLTMLGRGQVIPSKDEEIGLSARAYLQGDPDGLVMLVDDLEHDRRPDQRAIFCRYRTALDVACGPHYTRVSVHFLTNMLEAYYFAHTAAVVQVCHADGLVVDDIEDEPGDVEEIRHPKNRLKKLVSGFDEVRHGERIVAKLDLERILGRPGTCGALRALVAWCMKKIGQPRSDRFCLKTGIYDLITGPQIGDYYKSLAP